MVLVGNAITANDVVADPRYSHLKPDQVTTQLLSQYTQEQQQKYDFDALQKINSIKEEYGNGVSSLIRIYNASGRSLRFQQQGPNWSGHMWKYPFDETIMNGQWSVVLHVHTSGAARGSVSCFVYNVESEGDDVFNGWSTPWDRNLYTNCVYTEVRGKDHWPYAGSWDHMYELVSDGGERSTSTWNGQSAKIKSTITTGNASSPVINIIITAEQM